MRSFSAMITPRLRKKLERVAAETANAAEKPPKEVAAWLSGLARDMQDSGVLSGDPRDGYEEWAAWRVIPEIARRLRPGLGLRAGEIPSEEEKRAGTNRVDNVSDDRLAEFAEIVRRNTSFERLLRSDTASDAGRRAAELFFHNGSGHDPLKIGIAALIPGKVEISSRPNMFTPLPGFFVVISEKEEDHLLSYVTGRAEAEDIFDLAARRLDGAADEDGERRVPKTVVSRIAQFVRGDAALILQDYHGNVLDERRAEKVGIPDMTM